MVVNLKYYVITIVAIFLAIGVGIFIGIMLDGQDLIVEQQKELVAQLEGKFDEFKIKQEDLEDKIDLLTREKEKNEKFINILYPEIVEDKLKDVDVVVLETSEHYEYSSLTDVFKKAGAGNVTNIIIRSNFVLSDEGATQVASELELTDVTKEQLQEEIIKRVCNAMVTGENIEIIKYLKEKEMIDYTEEISFPMDYAVIAGGSINKDNKMVNKIDIPFINCIKSKNIPVVGVETLDVAHSNISEYKKLRISTVDNVDTIIGKISMLMVSTGKEGHFGEKDTAEALVPEGFMQER